jgi:hypothetical protein
MAGLWMVRTTFDIPPYGTNPIVNVYGYKSFLAVVNEADALATQFEAIFKPLIVAITQADTYLTNIDVFQLDGGAYDLNTILSPGNQGVRAGDRMPPFVAWAFQLNRAALGTRNGSKRIGLVSESDVTAGVAAAGILTPLSNFAAAYGAPLKLGIIDTWFPVILERPVGAGAWGYHDTSGGQFKRVSTQNTRKR